MGPRVEVVDGDELLVLEVQVLARLVGHLLERLPTVTGHPVRAQVVAVGDGDLAVGMEVGPERVER